MGEARQIMDAITEAATSGDLDRLHSYYAEDAVLVDPQAGELTGGVLGYYRSFLDAFPDVEYTSVFRHESGNVAIDEGWVSGTNTGPIALPDRTLPPTGKKVRIRSCDVLTVEDGKAVRHHFYYDQVELLGQLGLLPESVNA